MTDARDALMAAIRHKIHHHPRSQQKRIGPSEIGNPCDRRIGYKLLGHPERERGDAWKPTVGTAVHAWIDEALTDEDARLLAQLGYPQTTNFPAILQYLAQAGSIKVTTWETTA